MTLTLPASLLVEPSTQELEDRLSAARSLLGVHPAAKQQQQQQTDRSLLPPPPSSDQFPFPAAAARRSRSDSVGLDALALLCTQESSATASVSSTSSETNSSSSTTEGEQPVAPRRLRSLSNPEGMLAPTRRRVHIVLPEVILEEELAKASAAVRRAHELHQDEESSQEDDDNDDEDVYTAEELLQRARSRLLEDLSQSNVQSGADSSKTGIILPHALPKYKHVYNQNGRIGIYTPAERAAILARYQSKKSRRVWNKTIRYNCRKNLADRRVRVKGRFVKRQTDNMPNVDDPEAGFCPTKDQPYRRLRRHTVT